MPLRPLETEDPQKSAWVCSLCLRLTFRISLYLTDDLVLQLLNNQSTRSCQENPLRDSERNFQDLTGSIQNAG